MHSKTRIHTPKSKNSQSSMHIQHTCTHKHPKLTHIHTHGNTHASTRMHQQTGKTTTLQHSFIKMPKTTCTHSDACTNTQALMCTHQHAHYNKHSPTITHQQSRTNTHQHAHINMYQPTCTNEIAHTHMHAFTNM